MSVQQPAGPGHDDRLARAARHDAEAMRLRALCRGKMQTLPKCPIRSFDDFAVWYSPGVAAPSRAIASAALVGAGLIPGVEEADRGRAATVISRRARK